MQKKQKSATTLPSPQEIKQALGGFAGENFYVKKHFQIDKDHPEHFFTPLPK